MTKKACFRFIITTYVHFPCKMCSIQNYIVYFDKRLLPFALYTYCLNMFLFSNKSTFYTQEAVSSSLCCFHMYLIRSSNTNHSKRQFDTTPSKIEKSSMYWTHTYAIQFHLASSTTGLVRCDRPLLPDIPLFG